MSNVMLAQMGLSVVDSLGDYVTAKSTAKLKKRIQDFQNTMVALSAAQAFNANAVNKSRQRSAAVASDLLIQSTAMADQANAEVASASAGVAGKSANQFLAHLKGSAGKASFAATRQNAQIQSDLRAKDFEIRRSQINSRQTQVIPEPAFGALALNMGANILNIYKANNPDPVQGE